MRDITQAQFIDEWTEALESDKYNRGLMSLKQENTVGKIFHCCLGVACEVLEIPLLSPVTCYELLETHVPSAIGSTLMDDAAFKGNQFTQKAFIYANDMEHLTFPQVADYIRANRPDKAA